MKDSIPSERIRERRQQCGLTIVEAAKLVYVCKRTWINYEQGITSMPRGLWELFRIKSQRKDAA